MSLMSWMERLRRECRLGICSAPSAIPVHKTCLAVLYAAVCASARQLRWRSVPSAEQDQVLRIIGKGAKQRLASLP